MTKKALGILGGMGPLATADLYHKIVTLTAAGSDNEHIRVYIDSNTSIPDRTAAILAGGADPLPAMRDSLRKLEKCGAGCVIMPCNTAHYFLGRLVGLTELPFVSMIGAAAAACRTRFPGKTAAILGTSGTLSAKLYQEALMAQEVPFLEPDALEQEELMEVIYQGVKAGAPPESYRGTFTSVLESMGARGAGCFILGCTELPLAVQQLGLSDLPAVDPTEELERKSVE